MPEQSHKPFEGAVSREFSESVSEERIRLFQQAVGAEVSSVAPPTFLTVFRNGEFELFERMGLKLASVLHGEQQYSYESEIIAGDQIIFQTKLASVLEKKGSSGRMSFLAFETEFKSAGPSPRRIGSAKTTVIVRERASS